MGEPAMASAPAINQPTGQAEQVGPTPNQSLAERMLAQNHAHAQWLRHPDNAEAAASHTNRNAPVPLLAAPRPGSDDHFAKPFVLTVGPHGNFGGDRHDVEVEYPDRVITANPALWPGKNSDDVLAPEAIQAAEDLHAGKVSAQQLFRAYKSTPHQPIAVFLKYLVHRHNHVDDYADPQVGHHLDREFLDLAQAGDAARRNEHLSPADLRGWLDRNHQVLPEVLAHRDAIQQDILRGVGLNVRDIFGVPHVALTRGLNSDLMTREHPLSSWADLPDTGFGSQMHHAWVPVKDVWFGYPHFSGEHSTDNHENEYLVSHTAPKYEASGDDIHPSFLKDLFHGSQLDEGLPEDLATRSRIVHGLSDNATDAELAGVVAGAPSHVARFATDHKNAGPLSMEALRAGGAGVSLLDRRITPRETALQALSDPGSAQQALRNPNLTNDDLTRAVQFDTTGTRAPWVLMAHPSADSRTAQALWARAKAAPQWTDAWDALASSHLTPTAVLGEMVGALNSTGGYAQRHIAGLAKNPNLSAAQGDELWRAADYDRRGAVAASAPLSPDAMDDVLPAAFAKYITSNPHLNDETFAKAVDYARSGPVKDSLTNALLDRAKKLPLTPTMQMWLVRRFPGSLASTYPGLTDFLASKHLAPETVAALATHPSNSIRAMLYRNKSVTPDTLEAAFPQGTAGTWAREDVEQGSLPSNPLEELWRAVLDRRAYAARRAREHLIRPFPATLAKSEHDDDAMWMAEVHDWLGKQGTGDPGYLIPMPQAAAQDAVLRKLVMPAWTRELLEGQAVIAWPAKPHHYQNIQRALQPGQVLVHFRTDQQPQRLPDGRFYWTDPVQMTEGRTTAIGLQKDEDLEKAHGPFTFPKLGLPDDRRETYIAQTASQFRTKTRATANVSFKDLTDPKSPLHNKNGLAARAKGMGAHEYGLAVERGNPTIGFAYAGTQPATIAVAQGDALREVTRPKDWFGRTPDAKWDPARPPPPNDISNRQTKGVLSTVQHENLHNMFQRVQTKYGIQGRRTLIENLLSAVPSGLTADWRKFSQRRTGSNIDDWKNSGPEEQVTHLLNYLNNPRERDLYHADQKHSPEEAQRIHTSLKRVYASLRAAAGVATPAWTKYPQPWRMNGQTDFAHAAQNDWDQMESWGIPAQKSEAATPKFDSFESLQAYHGSHRQAMQKRTSELTQRYPAGVAFKDRWGGGGFHLVHRNTRQGEGAWRVTHFDETKQPTGHFATDSYEEALSGAYGSGANIFDEPLVRSEEHVELEALSKAAPTASRYHPSVDAFMKEFWEQQTRFNGFDDHHGRYHGPGGDRGALITMRPMGPAYHPHPTVGLEWLQTLQPGKGDGSAAMKMLTALADKHRVRMDLHAGSGPGGVKTSPKKFLRTFYAKHGFASEGRDPSYMSRMPAQPQAAQPALTISVRKAEDSLNAGLNLLPRGLEDWEEEVALRMLGHDPHTNRSLAAARFLTGGKREPDMDRFTLAMRVFGDVEKAALYAYQIPDSEKNLKALLATIKLGGKDLAKAEGEEPPRVESIEPGEPAAEDTAEAVQRAFQAGLVQRLNLNGRHSKGALAARDPQSKYVYLLKPGSGKLSPAAGVDQEKASQSRREVAFWHMADLFGLGQTVPRADLLTVDGEHEWAAIRLLGGDFRPLDEKNREKEAYAAEVLQPYLENTLLHRWSVLDYICGNTDSHGQNILVNDGGSVALIDHGSAFAGTEFDPAHDKASFIPFYLRCWGPLGFMKLSPEERLRYMPRLGEHQDAELRQWLYEVDPAKVEMMLRSIGIAPAATLTRLKVLRDVHGNLSDAVNHLWAGAPGTLQKSEPPQGPTDGDRSAAANYERLGLVHDNPAQPMMVWRVENEQGVGPYTSGDMEPPDEGDEAHPGPLSDFYDHAYNPGAHPEHAGRKFGFLKPEHATDWFGAAGMADLQRRGFALRQVPARRVWNSDSGRQVVYEPHAPKQAMVKSDHVVQHPLAKMEGQTYGDGQHEWHVPALAQHAAENYPVTQVPVEHLKHVIHDASTDEPWGSPAFHARAMRADTKHPLVVVQHPDGMHVADGMHRLYRHIQNGATYVPAYVVPHDKLPEQALVGYPKVQKSEPPQGPKALGAPATLAMKRPVAPPLSLPTEKHLLPFCANGECYEWAQGVEKKFPALRYKAGFYVQRDGQPADHAWTSAPDGTVYDTTYSQFNPRVKVGIFKPGTPEHGCYHSYDEHHPASDPGHCLLRALGRDEPCEAPGCDWKGTPTLAKMAPIAKSPQAAPPTIEWHLRNPETAYIEMMHVPPALRGAGHGRAHYAQWESSLPKTVKLVHLHAADTGAGPSDGFWQRMGYDYRYDYGRDVDTAEGPHYEASKEMWKGVNGHPTPETVRVGADDYE
jgi:hypothetical protein